MVTNYSVVAQTLLIVEMPKNAIFSTKKWLSDGKLRQGWDM